MKILYLAISASIGFGLFTMSHTSFADDVASFAKIDVTYNSTANILEITGLVYKTFSQNYVLTVFNPHGQLIVVSQMQLSSNDTFSQNISPSNTLWSAGNYTVKIASGPQVLGKKSFYFPGTSCCMQNLLGVQADLSKTDNVIDSPLKQLQSGIRPKDVICKPNLELITNHKTGSIACVRPETLDRLASAGWEAVRVDPKLLHMKITVYGSYTPLTLKDHFLKGTLNSQTGPVANATVSIFANGVPMGTATTFPDGCFQFNNWNEQKFSPKIDEYVKKDKMQSEHVPKQILFSARYQDQYHYPVSTQTSSYLYLAPPPIAPAMYTTEPQSLVENLTHGSTAQSQVIIESILKQSEISIPNLVLSPMPCGVDYDIRPVGNGKITQDSDGKFIITLKAKEYAVPGNYSVQIYNNPYYPTSTSEQGFDEIGGFILNVMKQEGNYTEAKNSMTKIVKFAVHSMGGSIHLGPDDLFNETEYYTGNVGQVIAGFPVEISVSDPYDMFVHNYAVPYSNIASDGSFNFTHSFVGKFGQDTYMVDFTYGNKKYELKFTPVVPP